jgi:hypothetical protein
MTQLLEETTTMVLELQRRLLGIFNQANYLVIKLI